MIIDLRNYDLIFSRKCEEIFEVNLYLDGEEGLRVREWIAFSIADIVNLYTINPQTLYGTLNIGADFKSYDGMDRYSDETFERFSLAYKEFGIHACFILGERLEPIISKAIDLGYSDIALSVHRYSPGALIINVRGITPHSFNV